MKLKIFKTLIIIFVLVLTGCMDEDGGLIESCLTNFDCEEGFKCENNECVAESGGNNEMSALPDEDRGEPILPKQDTDSTTDSEDIAPDETVDEKVIDETILPDEDNPQIDSDDSSDEVIPESDDEPTDSDTEVVVDETPDEDNVVVCGNGIVGGTEVCDDGINDGSYGTCNPDCTLAIHCGDGKKNGLEFCDSGENNGEYDYCAADCRSAGPRCGDGSVDIGNENCDDGTNNGSYGYCLANCQSLGPRCGDGVINGSFGFEDCDDGNAITETCEYGEDNCTVCAEDCTLQPGVIAGCGDGVIDLPNGEECDDSNNVTETCDYGESSCTVCSATCKEVSGTTSFCGDGNKQYNEECELTDTKQCDEMAGKGYVNSIEEECVLCLGYDTADCDCATGFRKDEADEEICKDINECDENTDNCDTNAACSNTSGSFTCACNAYYSGTGVSCTYCNTDIQCGSGCGTCDSATPKCKDNSGTTTCVECLTDDDCTSPETCNSSNVCAQEGPYCGNGIKDAGEACDDGDDDNTNGCKNNCTIGTCSHSVDVSREDGTSDKVELYVRDGVGGNILVEDYDYNFSLEFTVTHGQLIQLDFAYWNSGTPGYIFTLKNKDSTVVMSGANVRQDYTFTASCN